jgi:hypothetical protein
MAFRAMGNVSSVVVAVTTFLRLWDDVDMEAYNDTGGCCCVVDGGGVEISRNECVGRMAVRMHQTYHMTGTHDDMVVVHAAFHMVVADCWLCVVRIFNMVYVEWRFL